MIHWKEHCGREELSTTYISGQFYTLLSCAKNRDNVLLLNFEPEDVKLIESALEEMVCMRKESLFSWQHLLIDLNGISMCLFNIRLWNVHLEHFCSGVIYSTYSSLFCFSGTNINDSPSKHIDEILDDWKDIYENTQHGLALCCNVSKVNTIEVIDIHSVMEVLPTVLEIEKETFIGDSLLYAWCSWFFYRWLYFID